jgi:hypothetical protein
MTASKPAHSGSLRRREFLRVGLAGFGALSLPGLFRLRATAAAREQKREPTAVIIVWLRGGCSHLDTYDPKPDAPSDYRGPFATIASRTPGLRLSELLPRQARISDKFTILRSMAHTGGGHPAGSLQLLSGDPDAQDKITPIYPDLMSVAHYLRSGKPRKLPNYIGVNPITRYDNFTIAGPGYLGPSYEPFTVSGDPSAPDFSVPNVGLSDAQQATRLRERVELRKSFDTFRRGVDESKVMDAMDQFEGQAMNLLTSVGAVMAVINGGTSALWRGASSKLVSRLLPRHSMDPSAAVSPIGMTTPSITMSSKPSNSERPTSTKLSPRSSKTSMTAAWTRKS